MEEPIGKFCKTLAKFSNRLEKNCNGLKQSVERRPISLDSASTTFVQSLNDRVSVAATDLNMLESMAFSTVSFEELLGHCNEVLKKNQNDIFVLQDRIGYIPPLNFDEEEDDEENYELDDGLQDEKSDSEDDDELLDDSLSLRKFGISDASLATIASQSNDYEVDVVDYQPRMKSGNVAEGETTKGKLNVYGESKRFLEVMRDDYESLPKYMKTLVSWEELVAAIEKMNLCIGTKAVKPDTFQQAEIESLGLGHKTRSYLLVLIKMNRLCVETEQGVIYYKIM